MIFDRRWRNRRARLKLANSYNDDIRKAQSEKRFNDAQGIDEERHFELRMFDYEVAAEDTVELRAEAEKFDVPLPPFNDEEKWEQNPDGMYVLTLDGIAEMRQKIRKERLERRDESMYWVRNAIIPIMGLLIGILGLLVALQRR